MAFIFGLFRWIIGLLVVVAVAGYLVLTFVPEFGAGGSVEPTQVMRSSEQFDGKSFNNAIAPPPRTTGEVIESITGQFLGDQMREPPGPLPVMRIESGDLTNNPGLRVYWLGHAGAMIEIDGKRVLVDPVFSERVSPFDSIGPKRFHLPPIALHDLPTIDAVMISHDHYDHLDMPTAMHLMSQGTQYFVPSGIGNHLKRWGMSAAQITELDWHKSSMIGDVKLTSTPAQHYSGRGLFDWSKTLWSSWTVTGPKHRVYISGDTGYSPHFGEIGQQYGPFDLTIIKIGAYGPGPSWHHIHMPVEQAMQAHVDLRGKRMLPVHWGTFNMAFHRWDEPIEQALAQAGPMKIDLLTPKVGEKVTIGQPFASTTWWREVK